MSSRGGMGSADAAKLAANLKEAGKASRSLTFEIAGMSGGLGRAAGEAGILATTIAEIAGGEKMADMATGIGLVVAAIGTAVAGFIAWKEEGKEVAEKIRQVQAETAKLNAAAAGDTRLEKQIAINDAMDGELFAAEKMEHFYRKFPGLLDAIRTKAAAAKKAAAEEVNRSYQDQLRANDHPFVNPFGPGSDDLKRYAQAQADARKQLADRNDELDINKPGYNPDQIERLREQAKDNFDNTMTELQYELEAPARQLGESLGRSITGGIADGIATAIKSHSFGDGFKAITGSILIGLGDMMIEIGTQSLLAAQLLSKIIASLMAFAPEAAVGPALLLIAAGGALKGIGASMQGGGGGSRSVGAGVRGAVVGGMIGVTPSASSAGPLSVIRPVTNHFTIIGEHDPVAQSTIVRMVNRGLARAG